MNEIRPGAGNHGTYRIFDIGLSSNVQLAGLPMSSSDSVDWEFDLRCEPIPEQGWEWIHDWANERGETQLSCARHGADYLLRFPGTADFRMDFTENFIEAYAAPDTPHSTLVHRLLDQVVPRVLFHSGRLVVHASAVAVGEGRSVAFLGPSGRGKSTLAAGYWRTEAPVITDDCLLVQPVGSGLEVIPAYPALRLWADTLSWLELDRPAPATTMLDSGKTRLELNPKPQNHVATRLCAAFLLGDPTMAPVDHVVVEPLGGNQAMMALIESAFALDVVSRGSIRRNFALVGTLARSGLPLFTLNFPRQYDMLAEVRSTVHEVVAGCGEVV